MSDKPNSVNECTQEISKQCYLSFEIFFSYYFSFFSFILFYIYIYILYLCVFSLMNIFVSVSVN